MFETSTEETFEDGEIIIEEGRSGDWIYVIESGEVELFKKIDGNKITIEVLKPGDVFGEIAYFAGTFRILTARAVGKTLVGIIDRNLLDEEFNRLSGNFRLLLKNLALRLIKTIENAAKLKVQGHEPRLSKVLSLTFKSSEGLMKAFSKNISNAGIFIKTSKPFPKGERFFLKLILPDASEPLKIGGEVVWSRAETDDSEKHPLGMGVKFVEISMADRKKLKEELIKAKS